MKYNPHEYQTYTTDFILKNPVSAILLDMGLGKSVITLTAINKLMFDSFEIKKVLDSAAQGSKRYVACGDSKMGASAKS